MVVGGGSVCGSSASSGAVGAVTLRFFEGGILGNAVFFEAQVGQETDTVPPRWVTLVEIQNICIET